MNEDIINKIKKETIILTQTDPQGDMIFNAWKKSGIEADIIFKEVSKPIRMIRRLWVDYFLIGYSLWYGNWKKELYKYKTVIVHADRRTRTVPKWIKKHYPNIRVIYWYWNPVNKDSFPWLTRMNDLECWSFDSEDCKKYNMRQNIQYYYDDIPSNSGKKHYSDVYFIGHDKGRKEIIDEIKRKLNLLGYTTKFDVIQDGEKNIPYSVAKDRMINSEVILEVMQKGQTGCTLRALESLFMEKKLITTNKNIINEEFYNKNNIFIYGRDKDLSEFMKREYDKKASVWKDKYSIEAWLINFFENEEL